MHAETVLQKCLKSSLNALHAARQRVLLKAVEALTAGRRLTLMDVARSWPGAERIRAPLKALDRLLSNPQLHAERTSIYGAMAGWLIKSSRPVIIIDWSDVQRDRRWQLLRAAIPVGGRTLTVLERVVPLRQLASPKIEKAFLIQLRALLPAGTRPIIVTDAGFRAPWFRSVAALGWFWVGRLRHRTLVRPSGTQEWVCCKDLYAHARSRPCDFGLMDTVRNQPWICRVVSYRKAPKGRKDLTVHGTPAKGGRSRKNAQREREPWLLVASPDLDLSARQIVTLYSRRMQIELAFRDLKSHRYGQGFEDSLTRKPKRLEILLMIHALATFAAWLVGQACEASGLDAWLSPRKSARRLYSLVRLGREALVRRWPIPSLSLLIQNLRYPSADLLDQLGIPA